MKIKKYAAYALTIFALSGTLCLASCGDADGDGYTPMDDSDNTDGVVNDMTDGLSDNMTGGIRYRDGRDAGGHITKDAPDSANINF